MNRQLFTTKQKVACAVLIWMFFIIFFAELLYCQERGDSIIIDSDTLKVTYRQSRDGIIDTFIYDSTFVCPICNTKNYPIYKPTYRPYNSWGTIAWDGVKRDTTESINIDFCRKCNAMFRNRSWKVVWK